MNSLWIVTANAARARVHERLPDGSLVEVAAWVHPAGRQSGRELASDRPGRSERSVGDQRRGHTAYDPPTDPREKEHEHFARELAAFLDVEVGARRCTGLLLLASSAFLGELRRQLGAATSAVVQGSHALDLTTLPLHELRVRIDELLARR
jgi:protein required for attachment to host cells